MSHLDGAQAVLGAGRSAVHTGTPSTLETLLVLLVQLYPHFIDRKSVLWNLPKVMLLVKWGSNPGRASRTYAFHHSAYGSDHRQWKVGQGQSQEPRMNTTEFTERHAMRAVRSLKPRSQILAVQPRNVELVPQD